MCEHGFEESSCPEIGQEREASFVVKEEEIFCFANTSANTT